VRASGAGTDRIGEREGGDNDENSGIGDAGGVLRAFGADDGGLENRDREEGDEDSENGGAGGVLLANLGRSLGLCLFGLKSEQLLCITDEIP
jgi:hypothetical protein